VYPDSVSLTSIKRYLKKTRAYPLLARINWQLWLIRDFVGTKVWKKTSVALTPFGFMLASGSHPAYALMISGDFEVEETQLVVSLLDIMDVFVDVGANLGYYSFFALQRHKAVLAFEPQAQNLQRLFRGLLLNGWENEAEVYPMALSSKPGVLTLYGASGPSASLIPNWAGYSPRFTQVVPVTTLDTILAGRFAGQRLLIKIDVEGAEYQVLEGAAAILDRSPKPAWLVEICFREFHPGGVNPNYLNTFRLFWNAGYRAYTAGTPCLPVSPESVERWTAEGRCDAGTFNYLFIDCSLPEPSIRNTS
jgi:FkbM family methyltransferase